MILEQLAHGIVVIGEIPLGDKPPRPSPAGAKFLASQMRMQSMNPERLGWYRFTAGVILAPKSCSPA